MSDEPDPPAPESTELAPVKHRPQRAYSESEIQVSIAAYYLNGRNFARTAISMDLPEATLRGWVKRYEADKLSAANAHGIKEKRGDLAAKLESLAHTIVESMPGKVAKATLSQSAVALGIAIDKVRILRGQGLDPDPATELCRLLNINRSQLPERLELKPGEEIPEGFGVGPVIETQPTNPNSYEPIPDPPHKPDCASLDPSSPAICDCGALNDDGPVN